MRHIKTITLKELRSYFDSPTAYIFIILFLLLAGTYLATNLFLQNIASLRILYEAIPILFLMFIPAITMRLIAEEKRSGTMEIIATKGVKTGEIVIGKFLAAWALVIFTLIPTLIYVLTISFLGNIDIGQVFCGYLGLALIGGSFVAIGMVGSSLTESPIVALIVSFLLMLILFIIDKILLYIPLDFVRALEYFAVGQHFSSLARGVIDSRDIIFFISLIILSLLFATTFTARETNQPFRVLREFSWSKQVTRIILISALIILINLISLEWFTRIDLTSSRSYTLSKPTHHYVETLDDNFTVTAYFSSNQPPPYHNHRQYVQELLEEYRALKPSKFHYRFLDPADDPLILESANRLGIKPVQVRVIKNDKFQIEKIYLGMVFTYGGKHEHLSAVLFPEQLELFITNSIKKLTSRQIPSVGILQRQGDPKIEKMMMFYRNLIRQFNVTLVNLSTVKEIPTTISTLVIVNPSRSFSEEEKYQIDRFLMNGGKIAFFINAVGISEENNLPAPIELNLNDLFENYGWIINQDILSDALSSSLIQDETPTSFTVVATNFNRENFAVSNLGSVVFPSVSSIDTRLAGIRGVTATVLVTSSEKTRIVDATSLKEQITSSHPEGKAVLAAVFEGSFRSFASRKPIKPPTEKSVSQATFELPTKSQPTKVVVVADGDFVMDRFSHSAGNIDLAVNLINWLADEDCLAPIGKREVTPPPLIEVKESTKSFIKYFILAAPPIVVIFAGIIRTMVNAIRKKKHQHSF